MSPVAILVVGLNHEFVLSFFNGYDERRNLIAVFPALRVKGLTDLTWSGCILGSRRVHTSFLTFRSLPGLTNILISEILKANPNTVIVNQTGTPVAMPWIGAANTLVQVRQCSVIFTCHQILTSCSRLSLEAMSSVTLLLMFCLAKAIRLANFLSPSRWSSHVLISVCRSI